MVLYVRLYAPNCLAMADFKGKLQAFLDRWNSLTGKEGEADDAFSQEFTVSVLEEASCSRIRAS